MFAAVLLSSPAFACSIFMVTDGDRVFYGNNEDWKDPNVKIRYVPASDGRYGVIYFSHSNLFPQGGMNDQGLVFDYAATDKNPVTGSGDKPSYQGDLMDKIMRECATVEEALAVYDRYNLAFMEKFQTLISDATGDSAIIEGDTVLRKKGSYQITTNFYRSDTPTERVSCGRYKTGQAMLGGIDRPTVESVRDVLAAVHQEGTYPTQYSNVYDLKNRTIYLYHFHNFANVVKIDLEAELEKGARIVDLPALFPPTFAAEVFAERQARKELAQLKKKAEKWFPEAEDLNAYAWTLLTCKPVRFRDPEKALVLAKKAVAGSDGKHAGILDTLALAYFRTGDTAEAIETQRKAVALLPPGESVSRVALENRLAEFEESAEDR
jgi:tetratricopeptide (TPR) repeat protein